MYIDSPVFVKRKVLVNSNNVESGAQYHFGSEREQLAKHVRDQINQHSDDHAILEKFRKEAEQLKRQKFQAKRKRPPPVHIQNHLQEYRRQPFQGESSGNNPQIQPTYSRVMKQTHRDSFHLNPNPVEQQSRQMGYEEDLAYHYQKLLKAKDKELKKKQKKLQKSKIVIGKMNNKIEALKQQKRIAAKEQQMEMLKINALMQEMNYKIAENKIAFREELARLKLEMIEPTPNLSTVNVRQTPNKRNLSIQSLPKPSKITRMHDSQRFLQGPSLYYEIPAKQTIDLVQKQIDTNIQSADRGLKKMKDSQLFLESQFAKYKDL